MITMRDSLQIIVSDVDDTLAEIYVSAKEDIIRGINALLKKGKKFFFISGQGESNIFSRVVSHIDPAYRGQVLMGTCSGAEVWGFSEGELAPAPFYSIYEEKFSPEMKLEWRNIINQTLSAFGLQTVHTMPRGEFDRFSGGKPEIIMYEDRRAQITFEVVNACSLTEEQYARFKAASPYMAESRDLRISIIEYAKALFKEKNIPITARLAGDFAVDFAVQGVTKTTAIEAIMYKGAAGGYWGDIPAREQMKDAVEIWGDKFSVCNGGTDTHMCEAFPREVRAVNFRSEPKEELPTEFNVVLWDGEEHLCRGVAEYMRRNGVI